jgi:CcmD family protein
MDKRNFEFMFYGFSAAWLIVFGYVWTLLRRSRRMRSELKRLAAISGPGRWPAQNGPEARSH